MDLTTAFLDRIVYRLDRWLLRLHWPVDVWDREADSVGGAACETCKVKWPCDRFIEIDQRIDDRERA